MNKQYTIAVECRRNGETVQRFDIETTGEGVKNFGASLVAEGFEPIYSGMTIPDAGVAYWRWDRGSERVIVSRKMAAS